MPRLRSKTMEHHIAENSAQLEEYREIDQALPDSLDLTSTPTTYAQLVRDITALDTPQLTLELPQSPQSEYILQRPRTMLTSADDPLLKITTHAATTARQRGKS